MSDSQARALFPRRSRALSFRLQLILVLISLVLVSTGTVEWIAYNFARATVKDSAIRSLGFVADTRQQALFDLLSRQQSRAADLLQEARLTCGKGHPDKPSCLRGELEDFMAAQRPAAAYLVFSGQPPITVGERAEELANAPPPADGALARFVVDDPTSRYYVMQAEASDPDASVRIRFHMTLVDALFAQRYGLGETGESFLVDPNGTPLTTVRYPPAFRNVIDTDSMRTCLSGRDSEVLDEDYQGGDVIHAFRYLPEIGGGCVMAHIEQAEAFMPVAELRRNILGVSALFAVLAIVCSLLFARAFSRPVDRLTARARALQAGDFDSPVPMGGAGELRTFAATFATMASSLRDSLSAREAARAAAEAAQRRLIFLADASAALSESLDDAKALDRVARLAVPYLADWCVIDMLAADGSIRRVATAHADPGNVELAEAFRRYPAGLLSPVGEAIQGGRSEVVPDILDSRLTKMAHDEEHLRILREGGLRSYMVVPIRIRDTTLGAITLISVESGRRYSHEDLDLPEELARRAALAVDNARLYHDAQAAVQRTDESLAALQTRETQLRLITDALPVLISYIDNEQRYRFNNHAYEVWFGRPRADVYGMHVRDVLGEAAYDTVRAHLESVLAGQGVTFESKVPYRDAGVREIRASYIPDVDEDGRVKGLVALITDITDEKRAEEEMIKTSKLESIGLLAGGIAHDFNNILTAVVGNLYLMKLAAHGNQELTRRVSETEKAALRAKGLTQQLLTFAKGGAPLKKTIAPADLLREAAGFVLQGSNVRCKFLLSEQLWTMEVDEGQIGQVVHNIVINAQQAMPKGGTITIRADNRVIGREVPPLAPGRYVRIAIADEGTGIPKKYQGQIFDPYFTTKSKGSGLGLATAYSIIKRHQGHITVESDLGEGTTFIIYLPASDRPLAPSAASDGAPGSHVAAGARILFMDDEEPIRLFARDLLRGLGYEVECAADGMEVVDRYRTALSGGRAFDLVILDLTVPGGVGGCETLRRLREFAPDVRAIVSSGYSNDPTLADFRRFGFAAMISKPYEGDQLRDLIAVVLQQPASGLAKPG